MKYKAFQLSCQAKAKQTGIGLIIFTLILVIVSVAAMLSYLNSGEIKNERDKTIIAAMAEAKATLIGYAISNDISSPPYLPNPDLASSLSEGSQAGVAGVTDGSVAGKFPWRSLVSQPLKDGWNECLWYVVSGRFKSNPNTSIYNWDTQGQIDVIDGDGNTIASNLAALIVSPGRLLDGQDRTTFSADYIQCGGNYDARNYLDSFQSINAIGGRINYFPGSTDNRQASNASNKIFVLAENDYYNDRLLFITPNDIFDLFIKRSDFSAKVTSLLDDPDFRDHLESVVVDGSKGTNNVDCDNATSGNQIFCDNWKEMLLLKELNPPLPIFIDDVVTLPCNRVLLFGGQKTVTQLRQTVANKAEPSSYLENPNLDSFTTLPLPIFNGNSTFDATIPSSDILRCI